MRRAAWRARHAVERRAQRQVLAPAELEVDARLLKHHAEARAVGRRRRAGGRAVELDRAAVGGQQPRQHAERRGLAGAVGAEQAEDLAGLDLEADSRRARRARRSACAARCRARNRGSVARATRRRAHAQTLMQSSGR